MERSAAGTKALKAMNSDRNYVDFNDLMGLSPTKFMIFMAIQLTSN
jgi:hypothetical protein